MSDAENGIWTRTRLAEIAQVVRGRVAPQDHPSLRFVGMDNVEAHSMRLLDTVPAATMKSASVHFQPGDVLYGRLRPYLNKVIAPDFEGLASAEFIPLTMPDGVDPRFIQYRINASDFVSYASRLDEGDRPRVDYDQIGAFALDLPPTNEQHRIVAAIESYFTRLDDAVATLQRVQRNLKRYRASVLKAAVEGRLVPTEAELARAERRSYEPASALLTRILAERRRRWEEAELAKMKTKDKVPKDDKWKAKYVEPVAPDTSELPELPEGWCWASVDQVLRQPLINGRSVKTAAAGFPVLRLTALKGGLIDLREQKVGAWTAEDAKGFLVEKGDFLVSRGNGSIRLVGVGGLVRSLDAPVAFPDTMIRFRLSEGVQPHLFALVWNSRAVRNQIERKAKTTAGIFKVNQGDLENCVIPLPPAAEQHRIEAEIDRLFSVAEAAVELSTQSISRLVRLRQSILKWAFEGRLVDQDPSDEPASVLLERIRAEREGATRAATDHRRRARRNGAQ